MKHIHTILGLYWHAETFWIHLSSFILTYHYPWSESLVWKVHLRVSHLIGSLFLCGQWQIRFEVKTCNIQPLLKEGNNVHSHPHRITADIYHHVSCDINQNTHTVNTLVQHNAVEAEARGWKTIVSVCVHVCMSVNQFNISVSQFLLVDSQMWWKRGYQTTEKPDPARLDGASRWAGPGPWLRMRQSQKSWWLILSFSIHIVGTEAWISQY